MIRKQGLLYDVDPHNRLILKKRGTASNLKGFRRIIRGRFKTDRKNKLYYEIFSPSRSRIPQKIEFSGSYSLDKGHNLIFTLDKWRNQYAGGRLRLKTGIITADSSKIVFLCSSRTTRKRRSSYTMKLYGAWDVDKNNRLRFGVKREDGKSDVLTLFNAWKIGENREIGYSLGRGADAVILRGVWDIKDKHRIRYVLEGRNNSGLDFTASIGRIITRKDKARVRFNVIIGISGRKKVKREVSFLCRWRLAGDKRVALNISPRRKKTLTLKLTKDILGRSGIAYIEGFLKRKEKYLGGGLAFRW